MSDAPTFPVSRPRWNRSLILICEKCGKKLDDQNDDQSDEQIGNQLNSPLNSQLKNPGDYAQDLKKEWKKEFQSAGLWGESRIVVSSCLDVCPTGEMAVARVTDAGPEIYTFRPTDAAEFLKFLKERERDSS